MKEGRGGIGSNTASGLSGTVTVNNGNATINSNCSSITSSVSGTSTFGAGSSLRASRMHKPKMPKESKTPIGLNIFTEHSGKSNKAFFFWLVFFLFLFIGTEPDPLHLHRYNKMRRGGGVNERN